MESLPLIPKSNIIPNLDVTSLIRDVFQQELESHVPSKKLSENIRTSLEYKNATDDKDEESFNSVEYLENVSGHKDSLVEFADNVFEAYKKHEDSLNEVTEAELNVMQTHAHYLRREKIILSNEPVRDLLKLKRQPMSEGLNPDHVMKYNLLQGDAGLPARHIANVDFQLKNYKKWKRELENSSQDIPPSEIMQKSAVRLPPISSEKCFQIKGETGSDKKQKKKPRLKKSKLQEKKKPIETFRPVPKMIFFSGYNSGDLYEATIRVKNVCTKPMRFNLEPQPNNSPFKVRLDADTMRILPGLGFQLKVKFKPKSLDDVNGDIFLSLEDGSQIDIPLVAYLEPPLLKTHEDIDEYTNSIAERIKSSYIECGSCLTGDSSVIRVRFCAYGGRGEFFIMNYANWSFNSVDTVSVDNTVEIPPFRVFPAYFAVEKDEVIDMYVEFTPESSGTHTDNIVIACNNGEVRSLDLLGDGVSWHRYYFTFQDSLAKDIPVDADDDVKVNHYLNLGDVISTGILRKQFCIANNSSMAFEYRWEMRDAEILPSHNKKILGLQRSDVRVDPPSGVFAAHSVREFSITANFVKAELGHYQGIISFYIVNIPQQCIEEPNTVIRPTVTRDGSRSQTLVDEDDCALFSPRISMQGTYASLQDSIKSTERHLKARQDYSTGGHSKLTSSGATNTTLRKSKTYMNLGESMEEEAWCCLSKSKDSTQYDSDGCPIVMFDADLCGVHAPEGKVEEILDKHLWDYVDVLVDEIELSAEIVPTKVIVEPCLVEICGPLKIKSRPVRHQVQVVNFNKLPVTCKWFRSKELSANGSASQGGSQEKIKSCECTDMKTAENVDEEIKSTSGSSMCSFHAPSLELAPGSGELTSIPSSHLEWPGEECHCESFNRICNIFVDPRDEFTVPALSEVTCDVSISALHPGAFQETLLLSVNNGDVLLKLVIAAKVAERKFNVNTGNMDLGIIRKGKRYNQDFIITNETSCEMIWHLRQFKFDIHEGKLLGPIDEKAEENVKPEKGFLCHKGSFYRGSYKLDARKSGLRCSLLEFSLHQPIVQPGSKRFVLLTADVRSPKLSVQAPRFENAILAPAGMMYVGQKITKKVTLRNLQCIETSFWWGHSFGCHCRKLQLEITPQYYHIQPLEELVITIDITPLDEGIIEHCYIPCFFGRTEEPIILSVVGIAEKLNVTFEIISNTDRKNTTERVHWPLRTYYPNLQKRFLHEDDLLEMKCQCTDVEKEVLRVFGGEESAIEPERDISEVLAGEDLEEIVDMEVKSEECVRKSAECVETVDKPLNTDVEDGNEFACEESEPGEDDKMLKSFVRDVPSIERRLDFAPDTIQEYPPRDPSIEVLECVKYSLEFANVPYKQAVCRQFALRNETPIETHFKITIQHFGGKQNPPKMGDILEAKNLITGKRAGWPEMLTENQPLVIAVEPREGPLTGFDATIITVWVYGETWGEYRDIAVCEIKGLPNFNLRICVEIVGHPVTFPMFQNCKLPTPILRFDAVRRYSQPISRHIRVRNSSSIPITVTWMTFVSCPFLGGTEESEDPFNLCVDMYTNPDSRHSGEDSTSSHKIYLAKNTTDGMPSCHGLCSTPGISDEGSLQDSPQLLGTSRSHRQWQEDKSECKIGQKKMMHTDRTSFPESAISDVPSKTKTEVLLLANYGRINSTIFQVIPKELELEPHGEKKMVITFNPDAYTPNLTEEMVDFKATLTGCVRLKQEHANCPGLYFRHCGKDFIAELMSFTATVEIPVVTFEICKGDLNFYMNANEIVKSSEKQSVICKRFLFKNNCQSSVEMKIAVKPGQLFRVTRVDTFRKLFTQYNPELHVVEVEPGQHFEMSLECTVSFTDVMHAYEQLKKNQKEKGEGLLPTFTKSRRSESRVRILVQGGGTEESNTALVQRRPSTGICATDKRSGVLEARLASNTCDLNMRPMSSIPEDKWDLDEINEKIASSEEEEEKNKKIADHVWVITENICLEQTGLVSQILTARLSLSYPAIRVSPCSVDFGNVYLDDTALRYVSLVNLTGFSTEFKIKPMCEVQEFTVLPDSGYLPAVDFDADKGRSLAIEFTPTNPGEYTQIFEVYSNAEMKFSPVDLTVSGVGTWDEKYKKPKVEVCTKLSGIYSYLKK